MLHMDFKARITASCDLEMSVGLEKSTRQIERNTFENKAPKLCLEYLTSLSLRPPFKEVKSFVHLQL